MSSTIDLKIIIIETKTSIEISYKHHDKINSKLTTDNLEELNRIYKIYSQLPIKLFQTIDKRTITFPKLTIKN